MEVEVPSVAHCKHYKRNCRIVSPCCGIVYPCRICHDAVESHEINRKLIEEVECLICLNGKQPASEFCRTCGIRFADYYCSICKLWDDEGKKKQIYHCDACGICRIGPQKNYFHCDRCCACYATSLKDNHQCISGAMQNNCPICLEDMFSSRRAVVVLKCGHNIHSHCQQVMRRLDLLPSIRCPTCSKTTVDDPQSVWREIENILTLNPMPEEIRQRVTDIHCNDCCAKSSNVPLNLIAMKCSQCGSYNTIRN